MKGTKLLKPVNKSVKGKGSIGLFHRSWLWLDVLSVTDLLTMMHGSIARHPSKMVHTKADILSYSEDLVSV